MAGKQLLMLVGDFVEDYEAMVPFQMLLMVGHQVDAVAATVGAVPRIGRSGARGLVNAVLRRFLREGPDLLAAAENVAEGRYSHPAWLIDRIRAAWPDDWQAVLASNNERPPIWLRVNRRRLSRDAWRARLDDQDTAVSADVPDAVRLEKPLDVEQLPGFREGEVSVQDVGAQLAALLVAPKPGERILDACAAPGGKTGHLLECCPEARVTALDVSAPRLSRVRENLDRLGVTAKVVTAARAAYAADQTLRTQCGKELFEIREGDTLVLRDICQRNRTTRTIECQIQHRGDGVTPFGGESHVATCGTNAWRVSKP